MRSRTRFKLDEAQFFLKKFRCAAADLAGSLAEENGPPPNCAFYLSAFISAARAVTWVMRSEYGHMTGWESWYAAQNPEIDDAQILKVFTELRNRNEKRGRLEAGWSPHFAIDVEPAEPSAAAAAATPRYRLIITPIGDDGVPDGGATAKFIARLDSIKWSSPLLREDRDFFGCL